MERFIGLDAHGQSCTLCVTGASGKRPAQHVVETKRQGISTAPPSKFVATLNFARAADVSLSMRVVMLMTFDRLLAWAPTIQGTLPSYLRRRSSDSLGDGQGVG